MTSSTNMTTSERLSAAQHQLGLVLGFFGRVDSKLSVVLGIDLAMLGVLFTKFETSAEPNTAVLIAVVLFSVCLLVSFIQLFRGSFPDLKGGHSSLVYFREIGKLKESNFRDSYLAMTNDELTGDFLEQAWRNSRILTLKFDRLKSSYVWMACSAVPWAAALALLSHQGA